MKNQPSPHLTPGAVMDINTELLWACIQAMRNTFNERLPAEEKVFMDRIRSWEFSQTDDAFLPALGASWILPHSEIVRLSHQDINEKLFQKLYDVNKDFTPGAKTIGLIDLKWSRTFNHGALRNQIAKMAFVVNQFEKVFKDEWFTTITPSAGDDFVFWILKSNSTHEDLSMLMLLYSYLHDLWVQNNFFIDKPFLSPDQFYTIIHNTSVHSANLWGVTESCIDFARQHKIWGVAHYIWPDFLGALATEGNRVSGIKSEITSKVGGILSGGSKKQTPRWLVLTWQDFDALMLRQTQDEAEYDLPIELREMLLKSKIGAIVLRVMVTNKINPEGILELKHAVSDINIIQWWQKNDSLFLVDGDITVRTLSGQEKVLHHIHVVWEMTLRQWHKSIANADCDIQKGSQYLKISHQFMRSIMRNIPFGSHWCLSIDADDRGYINELFEVMDSRRAAENHRAGKASMSKSA